MNVNPPEVLGEPILNLLFFDEKSVADVVHSCQVRSGARVDGVCRSRRRPRGAAGPTAATDAAAAAEQSADVAVRARQLVQRRGECARDQCCH